MDFLGSFKLSLISIVLLGATGCVSTDNQRYEEAAQQANTSYKSWHYKQTDAQQVSGLEDLLQIPQLTLLIEKSLQKNPSLKQSAIALQIAYEQRGIISSERIPQLTAEFDASKDEDENAEYSADLTVSWELDLWGKISDEVDAAESDIASYEATYQSVRDALVANIMRTWLQINLQQQLIEIENNRLVVLESNELSIRERYRAGLGELEELATASSSSSSTRATLANYNELLSQYKRALWLLIGTNDEQELFVDSSFPEVIQPLSSLPEQDLARRPDLQSAYQDIVAQQYRTQVAYKELLPSISLSASLTDVASSPTEALFTSPAWSLLGGLTAPLFQGGELRKEINIAELSTESTYWLYQETLLNAVYEVENYLGQEKSLAKQEQHVDAALDSAKQSFLNYQLKYRQGLVDILDLLTIQQKTFDLKSQLTETTYNRLINRINLGLALGLGVSS